MMHWYNMEGVAAYEVEGANDKMRPTTLRDARKLNLVPSVTTIMSIQDKPALLTWIKNQVLDACIKQPFDSKKHDERLWRSEILQQSSQVTKTAQKYGTLIHDALEQAMNSDSMLPGPFLDVCKPVIDFLNTEFPEAEWTTEQSFTDTKNGFGGCVDLYCPKLGVVLDFKTKMKTEVEIDAIKAYDDHHIQTAAYAVGLYNTGKLNIKPPQIRRFNLFVGYGLENWDIIDKTVFEDVLELDEPAITFTGLKLTESVDFSREWGMFATLIKLWQLKNKYVPGESL